MSPPATEIPTVAPHRFGLRLRGGPGLHRSDRPGFGVRASVRLSIGGEGAQRIVTRAPACWGSP